MRETLIVEHQLRRAKDDEPDKDKADEMGSLINEFGLKYQNFTTHLRPLSNNDRPTEEWMRIHAERTWELCTSVKNMVSRLSTIPTTTVTAGQSLQPSITITAATGNPHSLWLDTNQEAGMCSVSLTAAVLKC